MTCLSHTGLLISAFAVRALMAAFKRTASIAAAGQSGGAEPVAFL